MLPMTGNGQEVLFKTTLSHQKSGQNLKEPFFLVTTTTAGNISPIALLTICHLANWAWYGLSLIGG